MERILRSLLVASAVLTLAAGPASNPPSDILPLPKARYKAECPMPPSNSPVFLGQVIPTSKQKSGKLDLASDIRWLSLGNDRTLVGFLLRGQSTKWFLVPYSTKPIFKGQWKALGADQFFPLGEGEISAGILSRLLLDRDLATKNVASKISMHPCFKSTWDGSFPANS